jgi:sugar lactone lactonase YvrE
MIKPECVLPVGAELGEGPVWLAHDQAVWFVDIKGLRIHRFEPATGAHQAWDAPAASGFIAPVKGGGWIAGLKSGLHRFDPASGDFSPLASVEPHELGNRLNDGFVDATGRLWFGSMHDAETELSGALYCFRGGELSRHDEGYCITNGPAMSPDGGILYHTDTLQRVIYAFDVGSDGALSARRQFARIEDGAGYPDGLVVDAEGCVWTGLFGGWGLRRYSPDGELIDCVRFPCANVTKITFGGADLRDAYVTTAWKGLSPEARQAQPLAGGLFYFRAPTPGLRQNEVRLG